VPTNPTPEIASITYGVDAGWDHNLVNYLAANGTLVSQVWDGKNWTVKAATLNNAPGGSVNFSSLAMTQAQKLYGVERGSIYEYEVNAKTDPFTWKYVGLVTKGDVY
jgi:hypothetical protein